MSQTLPLKNPSSNAASQALEFERVISPFLIRLNLYLIKIGRNQIRGDWDAEDGLQVVLSKSWTKWQAAGFEIPQSTFHWLAAIARGVVADRRRYLNATRRTPAAQESTSKPLSPLEFLPDECTSLATRVARKEQVQQILLALGKMDESLRVVVELHAIEGEPLSEIARQLNLSKSTIWTRLQQGLSRLNMELENDA